MKDRPQESTVAAWLSVRDARRAVEFYKQAFDATEVYRLDNEGGVVSRLIVGNSEFWLSDESPEHFNFSPESLHGSTTKFVLLVPDVKAAVAQAVAAGASVVREIEDMHGWRVGRVVDPFGHHWEIARQLDS